MKNRPAKILAYIMAVLLLFEVFARIEDKILYNAPLLAEYSYDSMLIENDVLGRRGKANGRFEKWILNSHGFRGPEISIEKTPGTVRIVTFGASETFGLYESPGKEWPAQLREEIKRLYPGERIEVINTAIAGLTLISSRDFFTNRVLMFKPDIVLIYQGFSEFLNMPCEDSTAKATRREMEGAGTERPLARGSVIKSLLKKSRVVPKIKLVIKEKGPAIILDWRLERKLRMMYDSVDLASQVTKLEGCRVDRYRDVLDDFVGFLDGNDIRVLLSEHDNTLLAGPDKEYMAAAVSLWQFNPGLSTTLLRKGYPVLNRQIELVAARHGAVFIPQKALLETPDDNFSLDGVHMTDKGAERLMRNFLKPLKKILKEDFAIDAAADHILQ